MRALVRSERGYTLVELITVLGVVGILMAIAAPAIQNHIALQQIRGAAREVVTVLREARESAVNEGVPRYVVFNVGATPRTYQVWKYNGTSWVAESNAVPLPESVTFEDKDIEFPGLVDQPKAGAGPVPANAAYFDSRGRWPHDGEADRDYTITLRGGVGRTVTLTYQKPTGQVTGL
jgi:prepilin-type N-terminal cleavage/methylation domain-containing protein